MIMVAGCANKVQQLPPDAPQSAPAPLLVWVGGEVRQPGQLPWTNDMTLADAIQLAGGFTDFAPRRLEIRRWDGSRESHRLTSDLRLKQNVVLRPGDQIISPKW